MDRLCRDNIMCCDDNCKRCANLIYEAYLKLKNKQENQYRVPSKEEWMETYCTPKQLAGYQQKKLAGD